MYISLISPCVYDGIINDFHSLARLKFGWIVMDNHERKGRGEGKKKRATTWAGEKRLYEN